MRIRHDCPVQCICCCTVQDAPLTFEAFIIEAFPLKRHFWRAFGALIFLLQLKGPGGGGGGKLHGPLLLLILQREGSAKEGQIGKKRKEESLKYFRK